MKKSSVIIAAAWVAALAASAAIVKLTSIGPVVFVISNDLGMGVHSGDALILIPMSLAAVVTGVVLHRGRRA